jgi:hypothetical protein
MTSQFPKQPRHYKKSNCVQYFIEKQQVNSLNCLRQYMQYIFEQEFTVKLIVN